MAKSSKNSAHKKKTSSSQSNQKSRSATKFSYKTAKNTGERIQKVLANLGLGSRREIEKLIEAGEVKVNNQPASIGQPLIGNELVQIKGRKVVLNTLEREFKTRVIALHKKVGEVCTRKDEKGRPTVFDDLPSIQNGRWVMIGRLDINTQGLLLFTNNGKLANDLMHPSSEVSREYLVRVFGEITPEKIGKLLSGIELEDGFAKFERIEPIKKNSGDNLPDWIDDEEKEHNYENRFYKVVLKEGRNREVRRLWEAVDCQVSRLKRIAYGAYELPPFLKLGKTVELLPGHIKQLKNSIR